jgi:deoxycytidylate deaminase
LEVPSAVRACFPFMDNTSDSKKTTAFILKGGNVHVFRSNADKPGSRRGLRQYCDEMTETRHAEVAALLARKDLLPKKGYKKRKKYVLVCLRFGADGFFGDSRPCRLCSRLITGARIKWVLFFENSAFVKETPDQCLRHSDYSSLEDRIRNPLSCTTSQRELRKKVRLRMIEEERVSDLRDRVVYARERVATRNRRSNKST